MAKRAAILVIGNEILSGRVQDKNVNFIAKRLSECGIRLVEVRLVLDIEEDIISSINDLKSKYDYIFTTGGIGPTHDDITSQSISKAFNLPYEKNQEAYDLIKKLYEERGEDLNPSREKMAFMPKGVELIRNDVTKCPGFKIDNIFVMAGIPEIMQNMFYHIEKQLEKSNPIISESVRIYIGESLIAYHLEEIQKQYPHIDIGSYPSKIEENHITEIVFKGTNKESIGEAKEKLIKILQEKVIRYDI